LLPDVVKLPPKISEIFHILEDLRIRPVDLLKLFGPMKCYFGLRGIQSEGGVPSTALWAIKTAACGMRIGKRRVHNVRARYTKDQLVDADPWQQA
jgi:hypothetical protein